MSLFEIVSYFYFSASWCLPCHPTVLFSLHAVGTADLVMTQGDSAFCIGVLRRKGCAWIPKRVLFLDIWKGAEERRHMLYKKRIFFSLLGQLVPPVDEPRCAFPVPLVR